MKRNPHLSLHMDSKGGSSSRFEALVFLGFLVFQAFFYGILLFGEDVAKMFVFLFYVVNLLLHPILSLLAVHALYPSMIALTLILHCP